MRCTFAGASGEASSCYTILPATRAFDSMCTQQIIMKLNPVVGPFEGPQVQKLAFQPPEFFSPLCWPRVRAASPIAHCRFVFSSAIIYRHRHASRNHSRCMTYCTTVYGSLRFFSPFNKKSTMNCLNDVNFR